MELKAKRAEFLSTLYWTQSIVERRNTMPILSNVLIEARDGNDVSRFSRRCDFPRRRPGKSPRLYRDPHRWDRISGLHLSPPGLWCEMRMEPVDPT
jgi:DNA polymerase III beta subunit, N-terminal domain